MKTEIPETNTSDLLHLEHVFTRRGVAMEIAGLVSYEAHRAISLTANLRSQRSLAMYWRSPVAERYSS